MCDCGEELARRNQAARRRGPGGVGFNDADAGKGGGCYACGKVTAGRSGGGQGGRGGRPGDGGSNQTEYWTNILGGAALFMGLFTLIYKTFDLGTLWRDKVNGIWGGVLDSMCHNYVKEPCAGLRIRDCKRKWTDGTPPPSEPSPSETCQATIIIELEDDD